MAGQICTVCAVQLSVLKMTRLLKIKFHSINLVDKHTYHSL